MILFEPGPPTPVHRLHPAVRELDRLIRKAQYRLRLLGSGAGDPECFVQEKAHVGELQRVRARLVGKRLRGYPRQRRLL